MLNLMNKRAQPGDATRSFSMRRLAECHFLVGFSKLGMGSLNSDAAIIHRTLAPGRDIRYAAVGLGDLGNFSGRLLDQLGLQLDTCIACRH